MTVRWIVAGALAPITILLHEGGHALVAIVRGCESIVIHWTATTNYCSDGSVFGGVAEVAAGPLVSWLLVLAGWLATRTRARPEAFVLAVCGAGRAVIAVEAWARSKGTDEAKLADLTGIPSAVWIAPQVVLAIITFVWAWRLARRLEIRRDALAGTVAAVASVTLYMVVVGPIVLP
ncbi:MAG: hypothetical protein ABI591_18855 [Kofleriaceae bacterium]